MDNKLYTVRVQSNREKSLSERLKFEMSRNEMSGEIFIPMERTYFIRNGKKTQREKIMYPGYIFVNTINLGTLEDLLKTIPGNSGILRNRSGEPYLMTTSEENKIKAINDRKEEVIDINSYVIGESVKIIGGPFDKFIGIIDELDKEKKKAKVNVSIFGRATPVDLQFDQLEKNI